MLHVRPLSFRVTQTVTSVCAFTQDVLPQEDGGLHNQSPRHAAHHTGRTGQNFSILKLFLYEFLGLHKAVCPCSLSEGPLFARQTGCRLSQRWDGWNHRALEWLKMALPDWITTLKAALHTIKASHSLLSGDLHSNALAGFSKGCQKNQEVQLWSVFVWARRHSVHHAQPRQTAVDWQRWCIFIILLNCAWCAIRIEISPARDYEFFMRVIWAEQFLICRRWAGFISHPMMSWLRLSNEAARQPLLRLHPAKRQHAGEGFESDTCCLHPNGAHCLFLAYAITVCLVTAVTARTQQLNGFPILCCAFSPFRASLRDSLHRGIRPRRTRTAWRTDMGTSLHVRTAAAHEFLRACLILQADCWLWITLSCSNSFIISQQRHLWPLQSYFSIHLPAVSFQLCKNKLCLPMAAPLRNLFFFFLFFFKQMQFYFLIKWCIICFIRQPFYSCWKTYI